MSNESNMKSCKTTASDVDKTVLAPEELRKLFREFVNDESKFRKFIETCNVTARQRGRLTYWQQQLWESFSKTHADVASLEFTSIVDAFYVCHVHMKPLHRVDIPIQKGLGCVTQAPEVEARISCDAPYSMQSSLDSPAWGDATHITVDHCDECLAKRKQIGGR